MRSLYVLAFIVGGCTFTKGQLSEAQRDGSNDGSGSMFVPSHVDPGFYHPNAIDLTGVTIIDTSTLQLNFGSGLSAPPTGIAFVDDGAGHAVLSVGTWTVDKPVRVIGSLSLVVIAAGHVQIDNPIRANAEHEVAGPGGLATGRGVDGLFDAPSTYLDSGGGGGGFGAAGAPGGDGQTNGGGGSGGASYGASITSFSGGSSGGNGGSSATCPNGIAGKGGGGGGAVQISSAQSISIGSAGGVNVNGGGGRGGCFNAPSAANPATAGGGGGSGGEIFVEAPTITSAGALVANGGGGGGGAKASVNPGGDGANGLVSVSPAAGGITGGTSEGPGGPGGSASAAASPGLLGFNAGGGGGGLGWIWLRTHGAAASPTGIVSPAPQLDTSL